MVKGIILFGWGIIVCLRNKKDYLKRKWISIKVMDVLCDKLIFFFFNFLLVCVIKVKFLL